MRIRDPYEAAFELSWFKGDIHFHSTRSDGVSSIEELKERLCECGFDFAAVADHDVYRPAEADSVPVMLANNEMRSSGGDVLSLFADVSPMPDEPPQALIEAIRAEEGLPILAHPKIGEYTDTKLHWAYSSERLIRELSGFGGMEIYTHNVGSGFQSAVDRLDAVWTYLRSRDRKAVDIWGFATSDAHRAAVINPNVGILVAAEMCNPAALESAIRAGRFYALAGSPARFSRLGTVGETLEIVVTDARLVQVFAVPQLSAEGDKRQVHIAWACDSERDYVETSYPITGKEGFLRVQAMDRYGGLIYANPITVDP